MIKLLLALTLSLSLSAFETYNYENGYYEEANMLPDSNNQVEIYNRDTGEVTYEEFESIDGTTLETFDVETSEYIYRELNH